MYVCVYEYIHSLPFSDRERRERERGGERERTTEIIRRRWIDLELCAALQLQAPSASRQLRDLTVGVGDIHVVGSLERLEMVRDVLAELALEGGRQVGKGRPEECLPVHFHPLAFFHAGQADATNDGGEHGVGQSRLDLNGLDEEAQNRDVHRLSSLDDLGKGHGTRAHCQDRPAVRASSVEADGCERLDVGIGENGRLAKPCAPAEHRPDGAYDQLGKGHRLSDAQIALFLSGLCLLEGLHSSRGRGCWVLF